MVGFGAWGFEVLMAEGLWLGGPEFSECCYLVPYILSPKPSFGRCVKPEAFEHRGEASTRGVLLQGPQGPISMNRMFRAQGLGQCLELSTIPNIAPNTCKILKP